MVTLRVGAREKERRKGIARAFLGADADVPGPVPRKMVKFNPGLNPVFLSKNLSLGVTKYCCVFNSRYSDDNTEC